MKFIIFVLLFFTLSFCDELHNLTSKGISAFKKNDYEKASQYFNEAAQKYPTNNEARFNKGLVLGASGNVKEAEAILSSVKFDKDNNKNAEVLYTRARIAEATGDAALNNQQQPNIAEAKKAYQSARQLYAQSLDFKRNKKTINNIEILSQKIKQLPEQEQQDNQDNQNKNDDKNNDNDKKDDNDDKNKQEQQEQEQEQEQNNEQNEQEQQQEQQEQEQEQDEEKIEDAMRMLEHYSDDAKELNKPPMQKAIMPPNGKDW